MKRATKIAVVVIGVVVVGAFLVVREGQKMEADFANVLPTPVANASFPKKTTPFKAPDVAPQRSGLTADKVAALQKIRRDYEEIRAKMSAEYGAAGEKFPGGLNAFLRQLALLEREMHRDFAGVLTPAELEDYEMQASVTGQTLQQRLMGMAVTDGQKRAVYRVQREFDDQFALVFDVTPVALVERVKMQAAAREKIRAVLGDENYAAWLRMEDPSYAAMRLMAIEQGLSAKAVTDLWRAKDDWVQRKLEIVAQEGLTPEQRKAMQAALAEQIRSRVAVLVGTAVMKPGTDAFGWLPPGP